MDKAALHYAVGLLTRRDYSAYELAQKMQQKAIDEQTINEVIAHCQQQRWQSDERFCHSFIRFRTRRGYGPLRIAQELKQKGIDGQLTALCFEEMNIDWFALAEQMFNKKFSTQPLDLKTQQKAWRFMASRGFHADHFAHLIHQSH
ncbi:recombination regulator RecX [Pasteurellaceae bacterium HPA106]|uniref:recombination regulator RecX n=1 Tax=Spirabiliibacterium pneumoniae TaxID=221400 RepID=UPI001AAD470B|nr:recombination regulator RecX [Spirabiliibacterium pneumoniae]MBE2896067.1 recombination regulator RecX [Spirabiliibacterium pneumoniae]